MLIHVGVIHLTLSVRQPNAPDPCTTILPAGLFRQANDVVE